MSKLKFLFLALILIFPIGEAGRIVLWKDVAITINDLLIASTVNLWFVLLLLRKATLAQKNHLSLSIIIFISTAFISLVLNAPNLSVSEIIASSLYFVRLVFYLILFFIVLGFDKKFRKKIAICISISGAIIVLLGFIQYFFYPDLRNLYYAGWDEHLYRMFSIFLDPNFAGAFFVLYLIWIIGLSYTQKLNSRRILFWLLVILAVFTSIAIFLTYSRSALIMFTTAIVVFLVLIKQIKWIVFVVLIIFFGLVVSPRAFQSEGTNILRVASSKARVESAKNALQIFADHPLLGVGFNAYRYAQIKYGFLRERPLESSHSGGGTDNSFIFVLATTGIVGFFSFLFMLCSFYKKVWITFKKSQHDKKIYSLIWLSSISALIIGSLFINAFFYPMIMEWVWILSGLTFSKMNSVKENTKQ